MTLKSNKHTHKHKTAEVSSFRARLDILKFKIGPLVTLPKCLSLPLAYITLTVVHAFFIENKLNCLKFFRN